MSVASPSSGASSGLPPNWRRVLDKTTGRPYFYNTKTRQTTWEFSTVFASASTPAPLSSAALPVLPSPSSSVSTPRGIGAAVPDEVFLQLPRDVRPVRSESVTSSGDDSSDGADAAPPRTVVANPLAQAGKSPRTPDEVKTVNPLANLSFRRSVAFSPDSGTSPANASSPGNGAADTPSLLRRSSTLRDMYAPTTASPAAQRQLRDQRTALKSPRRCNCKSAAIIVTVLVIVFLALLWSGVFTFSGVFGIETNVAGDIAVRDILTVHNSGQLGVNTAQPSTLIDAIAPDTNSSATLRLSSRRFNARLNSENAERGIYLGSYGSDGATGYQVAASVVSRTSSGQLHIKSQNRSSSDTSFGHLLLNEGVDSDISLANGPGSVGVGTARPTHKLHVTGGNVLLDGTVQATGNTTLAALVVPGSSRLIGSLSVDSNAQFARNISVTGSLLASVLSTPTLEVSTAQVASLRVSSDLRVDGATATFAQGMRVYGTAYVQNVTAESALVLGDIQSNGNLRALNVSAADYVSARRARIADQLLVDNELQFATGSVIRGPATFVDQTVLSSAVIGGNVNVSGTMFIQGAVSVSGSISLGDAINSTKYLAAPIVYANQLAEVNRLLVYSEASVLGGLTLAGPARLQSNLSIASDAAIAGSAFVLGNLTLGSATATSLSYAQLYANAALRGGSLRIADSGLAREKLEVAGSVLVEGGSLLLDVNRDDSVSAFALTANLQNFTVGLVNTPFASPAILVNREDQSVEMPYTVRVGNLVAATTVAARTATFATTGTDTQLSRFVAATANATVRVETLASYLARLDLVSGSQRVSLISDGSTSPGTAELRVNDALVLRHSANLLRSDVPLSAPSVSVDGLVQSASLTVQNAAAAQSASIASTAADSELVVSATPAWREARVRLVGGTGASLADYAIGAANGSLAVTRAGAAVSAVRLTESMAQVALPLELAQTLSVAGAVSAQFLSINSTLAQNVTMQSVGSDARLTLQSNGATGNVAELVLRTGQGGGEQRLAASSDGNVTLSSGGSAVLRASSSRMRTYVPLTVPSVESLTETRTRTLVADNLEAPQSAVIASQGSSSDVYVAAAAGSRASLRLAVTGEREYQLANTNQLLSLSMNGTLIASVDNTSVYGTGFWNVRDLNVRTRTQTTELVVRQPSTAQTAVIESLVSTSQLAIVSPAGQQSAVQLHHAGSTGQNYTLASQAGVLSVLLDGAPLATLDAGTMAINVAVSAPALRSNTSVITRSLLVESPAAAQAAVMRSTVGASSLTIEAVNKNAAYLTLTELGGASFTLRSNQSSLSLINSLVGAADVLTVTGTAATFSGHVEVASLLSHTLVQTEQLNVSSTSAQASQFVSTGGEANVTLQGARGNGAALTLTDGSLTNRYTMRADGTGTFSLYQLDAEVLALTPGAMFDVRGAVTVNTFTSRTSVQSETLAVSRAPYQRAQFTSVAANASLDVQSAYGHASSLVLRETGATEFELRNRGARLQVLENGTEVFSVSGRNTTFAQLVSVNQLAAAQDIAAQQVRVSTASTQDSYYASTAASSTVRIAAPDTFAARLLLTEAANSFELSAQSATLSLSNNGQTVMTVRGQNMTLPANVTMTSLFADNVRVWGSFAAQSTLAQQALIASTTAGAELFVRSAAGSDAALSLTELGASRFRLASLSGLLTVTQDGTELLRANTTLVESRVPVFVPRLRASTGIEAQSLSVVADALPQGAFAGVAGRGRVQISGATGTDASTRLAVAGASTYDLQADSTSRFTLVRDGFPVLSTVSDVLNVTRSIVTTSLTTSLNVQTSTLTASKSGVQAMSVTSTDSTSAVAITGTTASLTLQATGSQYTLANAGSTGELVMSKDATPVLTLRSSMAEVNGALSAASLTSQALNITTTSAQASVFQSRSLASDVHILSGPDLSASLHLSELNGNTFTIRNDGFGSLVVLKDLSGVLTVSSTGLTSSGALQAASLSSTSFVQTQSLTASNTVQNSQFIATTGGSTVTLATSATGQTASAVFTDGTNTYSVQQTNDAMSLRRAGVALLTLGSGALTSSVPLTATALSAASGLFQSSTAQDLIVGSSASSSQVSVTASSGQVPSLRLLQDTTSYALSVNTNLMISRAGTNVVTITGDTFSTNFVQAAQLTVTSALPVSTSLVSTNDAVTLGLTSASTKNAKIELTETTGVTYTLQNQASNNYFQILSAGSTAFEVIPGSPFSTHIVNALSVTSGDISTDQTLKATALDVTNSGAATSSQFVSGASSSLVTIKSSTSNAASLYLQEGSIIWKYRSVSGGHALLYNNGADTTIYTVSSSQVTFNVDVQVARLASTGAVSGTTFEGTSTTVDAFFKATAGSSSLKVESSSSGTAILQLIDGSSTFKITKSGTSAVIANAGSNILTFGSGTVSCSGILTASTLVSTGELQGTRLVVSTTGAIASTQTSSGGTSSLALVSPSSASLTLTGNSKSAVLGYDGTTSKFTLAMPSLASAVVVSDAGAVTLAGSLQAATITSSGALTAASVTTTTAVVTAASAVMTVAGSSTAKLTLNGGGSVPWQVNAESSVLSLIADTSTVMSAQQAGNVRVGSTTTSPPTGILLQVDGALRIASSGTAPTCDSSRTGTLWYDAANSKLQVCTGSSYTNLN